MSRRWYRRGGGAWRGGSFAQLSPLGVACAVLVAWLSPGCAAKGAAEEARAPARRVSSVQLARREEGTALFPCNSCHAHIEPTRGPPPVVGKHRRMVFDHFEGITDCFLCHDKDDMNRLRLLSDDELSFNDSHRLCGQCHGEKLRDFELGAHGKVVGSWRGSRYRYTCADCHDPHRPRPPQVVALPAPPFPVFGIRKGAHP